jgi:hypothetical protein
MAATGNGSRAQSDIEAHGQRIASRRQNVARYTGTGNCAASAAVMVFFTDSGAPHQLHCAVCAVAIRRIVAGESRPPLIRFARRLLFNREVGYYVHVFIFIAERRNTISGSTRRLPEVAMG